MAARNSRSEAKAARATSVFAYLASLTPEERAVLDMGKGCLHFKEPDDLELTSIAKVIAMSTPKGSIAYCKRVKGLA